MWVSHWVQNGSWHWENSPVQDGGGGAAGDWSHFTLSMVAQFLYSWGRSTLVHRLYSHIGGYPAPHFVKLDIRTLNLNSGYRVSGSESQDWQRQGDSEPQKQCPSRPSLRPLTLCPVMNLKEYEKRMDNLRQLESERQLVLVSYPTPPCFIVNNQ